MGSPKTYQVLCNSPGVTGLVGNILELDYLKDRSYNVHVALPDFIQELLHLPERILDLLEIAAYVYATDRSLPRGRIDNLEYASWARSLIFHIRVRDYEFWSTSTVLDALQKSLLFLLGDHSIEFIFYPGHKTDPTNLFDQAGNKINIGQYTPAISLFSGGIDSLAGVLNLVETTNIAVLMVSHQTQNVTKTTQRSLYNSLRKSYRNRVFHYPFECHLKGKPGVDESQRSRFFLYSSIALAVATAMEQNKIYVFENGVTSINLTRRQDLINARASRTTHPKTIHLFKTLFTLVRNSEFSIDTPFLGKTKTEVIEIIANSAQKDLLSSTVSCSRTITHPGENNHCGICFQCIDRRIASWAAGVEELDHRGLYYYDAINETLPDRPSQTTAIDYVRQGFDLIECNPDGFIQKYPDEISEIVGFLPQNKSELDQVKFLCELYQKHGRAVSLALDRMRKKYDDLRRPLADNSLLSLVVRDREHLKFEVTRLVERIAGILELSIPEMYRNEKPLNENDLNIKVSAILKTHYQDLRSEHPTISYAGARVVPDHELPDYDLLIESKYIRNKTTPSRVTDAIASDQTKYPGHKHTLFAVYDPFHAIQNDILFKKEIENKTDCTVIILR